MNLAIVHDMIVSRGGAERVLLHLAEAFPGAPIFTTCYLPHASYPAFRHLDITSSWYHTAARSDTLYKALYFPLGVMAARSIDLTHYDVVLQSTTHGAKYAKVREDALVVSYCYTPFRLLWNPDSYVRGKLGGAATRLFAPVLTALRKLDYESAQRPDAFWAMTQGTAERIRRSYSRDVSHVISPPVDCRNFQSSNTKKDYYLVVSRLEPYKQVDLVVKAFNTMGLPLRIAGRGTQERQLRRLARSNITFLGRVDDDELSRLYAECKALIFPQHEDYGLTPLEASASGTPVIAYGRGGILDTSVPFSGDSRACTTLLFDEQTTESLIDAVERSRTMTFDPAFIRRHAERFDVPRFIERVRAALDDLIARHATRSRARFAV